MFGFKSLSPLTSLLEISNQQFRAAVTSPEYSEWVDGSKPSKPRLIQDPRGVTERLHYRLYELLDRVQRPAFLHSATRGRSFVTNARAHVGPHPCVTTDMKDCYQSTTAKHVRGFFEHDLKIAPDLAHKLAQAATVHGHLPTGSCLSPLLAYWAHRETFDRIAVECERLGVTLTVYVDDLTLSGTRASLKLLHRVKQMLREVGLDTHKDKSFARGAFKHITGVAVSERGLQVPNRRLHRLVSDIDGFAATSATAQKHLADRISGGIASASAISRRVAVALTARRKRLSRLQSARRDEE